MLRLQYQSGKPTTTTAGYNAARGAGFVRFDVRVDKRVVWRSWLLDFYVDVTNVALLPEEVSPVPSSATSCRPSACAADSDGGES